MWVRFAIDADSHPLNPGELSVIDCLVDIGDLQPAKWLVLGPAILSFQVEPHLVIDPRCTDKIKDLPSHMDLGQARIEDERLGVDVLLSSLADLPLVRILLAE